MRKHRGEWAGETRGGRGSKFEDVELEGRWTALQGEKKGEGTLRRMGLKGGSGREGGQGKQISGSSQSFLPTKEGKSEVRSRSKPYILPPLN